MTPTIAAVLIAIVSYFIGSIPFGLLMTRWIKGVDLRTFGSGNIGATNTSRVLGKKWGTVVLLLDVGKGLLPTLLLWRVLGAELGASHAKVLSGTCAILGHVFPVWLGFRGGKGVATALGVAAVLAPWATLAAAGTFALVFFTTRIVSLGSVLGAAAFAGIQIFLLAPHWFNQNVWSLTAFSAVIPTLIIVWHRSNIQRLLRGEEQALSGPQPEPPTAAQ